MLYTKFIKGPCGHWYLSYKSLTCGPESVSWLDWILDKSWLEDTVGPIISTKSPSKSDECVVGCLAGEESENNQMALIIFFIFCNLCVHLFAHHF